MVDKLSRRGFVVGSAALAAGACLPEVDGEWQSEGSALCAAESQVAIGTPTQAGRVVELEDPAMVAGFKLDADASAAALKRLLLALTGAVDLRGAWETLIPSLTPGQVIGIKVNALNDRVPTHPELVRALTDSLKAGLGLPAEQILVWDRRLDELNDARLTSEALGVPIEGTWEDPKGQGTGRGYERSPVCIAGRNTHVSNIVTRRIDHLINFAVIKNHKAAGFTGVMKNHYGTIDNPSDYHDVTTDRTLVDARFTPAIPALNALDEIAGKTRLWLLDGTIGVCKGDTSDPPDCFPKRILASLDPVALDERGRAIRDEQRGEKLGPDPETTSRSWLDASARAGLGSGDVKLETVR